MGREKQKNILILSVLFTSFVLTSFFKISSNIVIPIFMEKFRISASVGGIISGFYFLPYAVMQLFAGPLAYRYGTCKVIGCGFLVATLGSLCFAFASNQLMVILGRFLVGVGVGPVFISVISYLTKNYNGRKFATLTGLSVTFSALGQVIASAPLKILVSLFGIKNVFIVLALLMALISTLLLALSTKETASTDKVIKEGIFHQIYRTLLFVMKKPVLTSLTFSWILYNSIQHSYQGLWSTKWSESSFPSMANLAGMSATLVSFGLMVGTLMSERLRGKNLTRVNAAIRSEALFALSSLLVPVTHFTIPALCYFSDFLLGYFIGDICIQQTSYSREISDDSISASIVGFMNFCSSIGTIVFQWLTGLSFDIFKKSGINDNLSFSITFLIFAALDIASALWCITKQKTLSKEEFLSIEQG